MNLRVHLSEEIQVGISPRQTGFEPFRFEELFGNRNEVVLEIGSGKGRFLLNSAASQPDRNFIGIERSLHYYRVIVQRAERGGLPNVRVINYDAAAVLGRMFPDDSVSEIHIYFPDPWPRPRERKRRLMREEVLEQFRRILVPGGFGLYVTDHLEYFEKTVPVVSQFFHVEAGEVKESEPRTNYEAKYREQGRRIYQVKFTKTN